MNLVDTIVNSFNSAIGSLVAALPSLISALVLLIVGWVISSVVARIVATVLQRVGADRLLAQHGGKVYGPSTARFKVSDIAALVVKWLIRLVFLIAAANLLGLPQVSILLNQILLWLPNLIVAVIILLVAPIIGRAVRGAVESGGSGMGFSNASLLGRIAEIAIIAFAVVIAVNQVGIAANLINILFLGIVAALALAFGLAFGLGGRDVAAQVTQQWYTRSQESAHRIAEAAASSPAPSGPTGSSSAPPLAAEPPAGDATMDTRRGS